MPTQAILINDKTVKRLPPAMDAAGYVVRDTALSGFHMKVGKSAKTFRLRVDVWRYGKREAIRNISLGKWPATTADTARHKAEDILRRRDRGQPLEGTANSSDTTLADAWAGYEALLIKNERSPRTIADYRDKYERHLKRFHNHPLRAITRAEVMKLHGEITKKHGPYAANGTMRVAHAIYNFAVKELEAEIPSLNPFRGRNLLNKETPRKSGMGTESLRGWWSQVKALDNPIMRELHLITLLSGLRRETVSEMEWKHVHASERYVEIPNPKGGEKRAFKVPLSRPMLRALWRVRRIGRVKHEVQTRKWVFPSGRSASGHIEEIKGKSQWRRADGTIGKRVRVEKTGHALRHSFVTLATAADVPKTII
jgi:site-specific recombinase XerD